MIPGTRRGASRASRAARAAGCCRVTSPRTEKDDLYGLKMTKQSDVTEETIAYALRANSKDDIGEGYNHYETVSMSAITKVEVGEEVAVKVVRKSRLVDWIMDMGDDYGARFTGFKL